MADPVLLTARGPLDGYADRFRTSRGAAAVELLPRGAQFNLRVAPDPQTLAAVEAVLEAPLPGALAWSRSGAGDRVVWLGPDEWLVLTRLTEPVDVELAEARLREAVGEEGAAVDQSGQRLSLLVAGDAAGLLAKGTGIDLTPRAFPVGSAAQGLLAQAVVVFIARTDGIELVVRASFARFVADWLLDALRDPLAVPAGG